MPYIGAPISLRSTTAHTSKDTSSPRLVIHFREFGSRGLGFRDIGVLGLRVGSRGFGFQGYKGFGLRVWV